MFESPPSEESRASDNGRRKDFFQGVASRRFSQNFFQGAKVVKFVFYPLKLKKQPFFANNFKIQGVTKAPLPPPSDAHASDLS